MQVITIIKSAIDWAKSVPSEPSGHGSSSRIVALAVSFAVVGVLVGYFKVRHELPSAEQLYGLAAILGTGLGGYVANRFRPNQEGGNEGSPDQTDDAKKDGV